MKKLKSEITSVDFDEKFDKGQNVANFLDIKKARANKVIQRVNIDFPVLFLKRVDEEARRIGVTRTALIKIWMAERLEYIAH